MGDKFELPEDQRVRLTRTEMASMNWLLNAASSLRYARSDLGKRLDIVPQGKERLLEMTDRLGDLIADLLGTVGEKQRRHLWNTAHDMEIRLVPKNTPQNVTVIFTKDEAMELVSAAQKKCVDCFADEEESRGCRLRKLLEVAVPLEDYSAMGCPYSRAEWED